MQLTGSLLSTKRNFYTQTGNVGFVMSATVDTTTGAYHFGLSGAAGTLDFRLESGRMYWDNMFVQTYKAFEEFTVEAQFSSGHANVLRNNAPLVYGDPKATGYFDYFYFNRASTDMGAVFDLQVSGNNVPLYTITQQGYLYASGQNAVTGWFANQSQFPVRVFDSTIQASVDYSFGKLVGNVGVASSGSFAYTGDYSTIDFSQPILTSFATNAGEVDILFSIIDARSFASFVQLTGPTDFTFNSANVLNRDVSYLNFSGGFVTDGFNTNLTFLLSYVSGSGNFSTLTGYSVPGLGRFQQSGLLTGLVATTTGSWPVTGFGWATGAATGFFSGVGTGIASGIGYTGLATGYMTGRATGFIFDGSGTLGLLHPLVGTGVTAVGITLTGSVYATGYIDMSSLANSDVFQIILPNGTNYTSSPLAQISCTYSPLGIPSCNLGSGPGLPASTFANGTDLVSCLSGYTALGINGVFNGFNRIDFTSTLLGTGGNGIAITGVTSTIVLPGSGYLTGGSNGVLPLMTVRPIGQPYTGAFPITITGSGLYTAGLTGLSYFPYAKTFTGSWNLATGVSPSSLINFVPISPTLYSGSGLFQPNSFVNMQVTYNPSGTTPDGARLIVTGAGVINGINQLLSLP